MDYSALQYLQKRYIVPQNGKIVLSGERDELL